MYPPSFDYYAPTSVDEAVRLLDQHQGEAKVLAGGQSLIGMLKLRLAQPGALIDINRIPDLSYVREDASFLRIGAMTRINELHAADAVKARYGVLFDASAEIADPTVRNWGTVGGNAVHGDPGNDLPACFLALDAEYQAQGPKGSRTIAARKFYTDSFTNVLAPNEIVTEIHVPKPPAGSGSAYSKMERKVGDFATAAVAVTVTLAANASVAKAGIGLTNVGPTAIYAADASTALVGKTGTAADLAAVADLAAKTASPVADNRGPVDFKQDMIRVWTRRTVTRAIARAKGGS